MSHRPTFLPHKSSRLEPAAACAIQETFGTQLPSSKSNNARYWVVAFGNPSVALHNYHFDAGLLSDDIGAVEAAALRTAGSIADSLSSEIMLRREDREPENDLWVEAQSLRHIHLLLIEAPLSVEDINGVLGPTLIEIKNTGTSVALRRHHAVDSGNLIEASINVSPRAPEALPSP